MQQIQPPRAPVRIVILGGGFGGTYAARHLERMFGPGEITLTLVSRDNFLLFTPMLHEVAASDVDATHIVSPLRQLLRRGTVLNGDVTGIDPVERTVTIRHGHGHEHCLGYDHLVVALGSTANFFHLPGVEERALTMRSLGDAMALRDRVIDRLEQAEVEGTSGTGAGVAFVVAGAGFAGVETIGAINDMIRESLRFYPGIDAGRVRMVLTDPGPAVLPELGPELGAFARGALERRGIEVRSGTSVGLADARGVHLSDGSLIEGATLVWTAGSAAHPLLRMLPGVDGRGRLPVLPTLQVPDQPGLWALGDAAVVPDPDGKPYPPTAQHAIRQARVLAGNIRATIKGGRQQPFVFTTLGQLAAIGRRTGVARILGLRFSGIIAWFLWRSIYLAKLPRFERKVRVAIDWTLDLVFPRDLVRFELPRPKVEA